MPVACSVAVTACSAVLLLHLSSQLHVLASTGDKVPVV